MSSSDIPSVFPAYIEGGRFAPVDQDHQNASSYVLTILGLIYSLLALILRVFLKRGTLGPDDAFIGAATLVQCGQTAAVFLALAREAGTSFTILSQNTINEYSERIYSANLLFILSLALAKASVICLLMRLFNLTYSRACQSSRFLFYRRLSLATLGLTATWAIGSMIGLSVNCEAAKFLLDQQSCPAQTTRWAVIMALDVLLEILLMVMTVVNVFPLQLSTTTKGQLIISFAFRLPCIAFSVLHYYYVADYINDSDGGLRIVLVLNMTQIYLCWSLISATIPTLKAFVKSFNSGFGLGVDATTAYFASAPHSAARHDYELGNIKSAQQSAQRSQQQSHSRSVRVEQPSHQPEALRERGQSSLESENQEHDRHQSLTSSGSQDGIIRKDVRWTVERT